MTKLLHRISLKGPISYKDLKLQNLCLPGSGALSPRISNRRYIVLMEIICRNYSIKRRSAYFFLPWLGAPLIRGRRLIKHLIERSKNDLENSNIFFLLLVDLYTNQQKKKFSLSHNVHIIVGLNMACLPPLYWNCLE